MSKIDNKEIIISTVKSVFGIVPFAGTALNELFFGYRTNLKQKRLNNFVEILAGHFTENQDVNLVNIKTEDFSDLFEAVLMRVVKTKSNKKLVRFKNILIKEIKNPTEHPELIDLYLDLITSLSETELVILFHHKYFDKTFDIEREQLDQLKKRLNKINENKKGETIIIVKSKYEDDFNEVTAQIKEIEDKHKTLEKYRISEFYGIDDQNFVFYKQRLFSKGLVLDWGIGRIGVRPFKKMSITEFGTEFIDFIIESE
ncbi:MAG: hypothetical protein HQ521_02210 [Bacteroidetes bacterium]|nr:hypothetical protein [Bacteroidota bacterium]